MTRARSLRLFLTLGLGALCALGSSALCAPPARAADELTLSADGETFASTMTVPLVQVPGIVPGDLDAQTLWVRNGGPTAATLQAEIVDVQAQGADDPDHLDALQICGRPVSDLLGRETTIATRPLPSGKQVPVTVDYELDVDARTGYHPPSERITVSFELRLTLRGETPTGEAIEYLPYGGAGKLPGGTSPGGNDLALTGTDFAQLGCAAAAGLAIGWLLLAWRRRAAERGEER